MAASTAVGLAKAGLSIDADDWQAGLGLFSLMGLLRRDGRERGA